MARKNKTGTSMNSKRKKKKNARPKGNLKKKGESGGSAAYVTRSKAVRMLQLPFQSFMKLCIYKGVIPRYPRKTLKGRDKTYYLKKDVRHLIADPMTSFYRELDIWKKKVERAKEKKLVHDLDTLRQQKPAIEMDYIIKRRFPTFKHALFELDDALSVLSLFSVLPANRKHLISKAVILQCERLMREFLYYVIQARALRKVFVSIKGIYYQVSIEGEDVTWLVPHSFPQSLSTRVNYAMMLTYVDLYQNLLRFVNFRLFQLLNLSYPPKINARLDSKGATYDSLEVSQLDHVSESLDFSRQQQRLRGLNLLELARKGAQKESKQPQQAQETESTSLLDQIQNDEDDDDTEAEHSRAMEEVENVKDDDSEVVAPEHWQNSEILRVQVLFSNLVFLLDRAVPFESLDFVIRSCGGKVYYSRNRPSPGQLATVTHVVTDLPPSAFNPSALFPPSDHNEEIKRDYVQPQWVYDCVNAEILLPVQPYHPKEKCPPHLSPFGHRSGYIPPRAKEIEKLRRQVLGLDSFDPADHKEEDYSRLLNDEEEQILMAKLMEKQHAQEFSKELQGASFERARAKSALAVFEKDKKRRVLLAKNLNFVRNTSVLTASSRYRVKRALRKRNAAQDERKTLAQKRKLLSRGKSISKFRPMKRLHPRQKGKKVHIPAKKKAKKNI